MSYTKLFAPMKEESKVFTGPARFGFADCPETKQSREETFRRLCREREEKEKAEKEAKKAEKEAAKEARQPRIMDSVWRAAFAALLFNVIPGIVFHAPILLVGIGPFFLLFVFVDYFRNRKQWLDRRNH